MKHNLSSVGLSAFMILIFSGAFAAAIGIGISPNTMEISSALRGMDYDRPLSVFNTGDFANNYSLSAGGGAGGWISFYEISDNEAPVNVTSIDGKSKRSFIVRISVPNDTPSGTYNATIYAKTVPSGANKSQGTIEAVLMARTLVEINVTGEQIVGGAVSTITIEENTEPGYPLRIVASFKNTGNVVASPQVSVSIEKDGEAVSSFTYPDAKVKPSMTETIFAEWNTTSAESVGDYLANVVVSLDGNELATNSIPFKVLPVGTLTRQGNLTSIVLMDEPVVGSAVKINANFINTGRIDTLAKFSGEVYRDGVRIDALASDEILVGLGKEVPLVSYLKISSPGNYQVKGRIVYSGKETEINEISFTVPESKTAGFGNMYAILAVGLLVMGGVVYVLWRRTR